MGKHVVQSLLEESGYECREYSGRGMCGKSCLAADITDMGKMIADVIDALPTDDSHDTQIRAAFRHMSTDSMGRSGQIVYFPSIEYVYP